MQLAHKLVHAGEGRALFPTNRGVALTVKFNCPVCGLRIHAVALREHLVERRAGKAHKLARFRMYTHLAKCVLNALGYTFGRVENSAVKIK